MGMIRDMLFASAFSKGGGANIETGTFTATQQSGNVYKINFSKAHSRYILYAEMTAESKTALMDSGQASAKMFSFSVVYPSPKVSDENSSKGLMSYRITPTTGEYSVSSSSYGSIDESSITLNCQSYANGANILYTGSTYNYMVIPV